MIDFSSVAEVPRSEPFAPVIPIRPGMGLVPVIPRRISTSRATALSELITRYGVRRKLVRGNILFSKGDRARFWYFLEAGTLVLDPPETAPSNSSTTLRRGEFFSLSAGDERIATCRALDDATVICIDLREVESMAARNASFGEFLRKAVSRELDWLAAQAAIASSLRCQNGHRPIDNYEPARVDSPRMRHALSARARMLRAQEVIADMVGPLPPRR